MTIEERIAALEAKIAAMTSVQEPTEYYMSKYSGEEADSLLDKVKNGEAGGGSSGVSSFNGRTGDVTAQIGDYTAEMVGAPSLLDRGKANGFPPLDKNTRIPMEYLYEEAVGQVGPPGKDGIDGKDGKDFAILGYFDTFTELELSVLSPNPGDSYGVGITAPYDIYIWDGMEKQWKNNGPLSAGNKIDKVTMAIAGNIPTLTADGQIQDSGKKIADVEKEALEQITTSPEAEELTDSDAFATVTATGFKRTSLSLVKQIFGKLFTAKPKGVTAGNFASLDAEGNLQDSGKKPLDFAPGGFGLGGTATLLEPETDLNNIKSTGWYSSSGTSVMYTFVNLPDAFSTGGGVPLLAVESSSNTFIIQTFYRIQEKAPYSVDVARRQCTNGVWYPWEYVNPQLMLGMEYRTIERYNGKPVYTKLFNFGYMPVDTYKVVAHNIQNVDSPIAIFGEARGAFGACAIPSKSMSNGYWNNDVDVLFDKANVQIVTRNANTGILTDTVTALLVLKYTKTTD